MIRCKEIDDYLEYAKNHPGWINKERRQLIKRIVLPTLQRDDIYFDEETYRKCIRYCEKNYYPLFPYQKFIYAFIFMYEKADDEPVFPNILIMMGRGNGKDGFIVPLVNFLQTPMYGVKGYHVEIVANSEDQAKDTFKVAHDMITGNQKLKGKFHVTKELITNKETGSDLKYNTSNAKTKDGKKIGCLLFNEYHAYENYDQINVFESAMGKIRHERKIIITTNGHVRGGPLDELMDMMKEILSTGINPLGYFPFICKLDKKSEVDSEEAWHKANPSLEFMPILYKQIRKDYLEMKKIVSKVSEFLAKRMNIPQQKQECAVTDWDNILKACYSDLEKLIPRNNPSVDQQLGVIGLDYADIRDFASAGLLTEVDGEYIWRQKTWINANGPFFNSIKFPLSNIGQSGFEDFVITTEPVIPVDEMVDWCIQMIDKYEIKKIAMDTFRWTLFKDAFEKRGLTVESKDNPDGMIRLIRRIGSVTGIIAPFIESLFSEAKINFGNSAIMRWFTNNTSVSTDKYGNKTFGKIEPKLRKNDGFMAFMVAMFCKDELEEVIYYV